MFVVIVKFNVSCVLVVGAWILTVFERGMLFFSTPNNTIFGTAYLQNYMLFSGTVLSNSETVLPNSTVLGEVPVSDNPWLLAGAVALAVGHSILSAALVATISVILLPSLTPTSTTTSTDDGVEYSIIII